MFINVNVTMFVYHSKRVEQSWTNGYVSRGTQVWGGTDAMQDLNRAVENSSGRACNGTIYWIK